MQEYSDYRELVNAVKKEYKNNASAHRQGKGDKEVRLGWADYCEEINLYTYWQGMKYAENKPHIKYMLVAQDWGNPQKVEADCGDFAERIRQMNEGKAGVQYVTAEAAKKAPTDGNLVKLFEVLGYKDITSPERYPELFFTNFCLGYRIGRESGGMGKRLMMMDRDFFYSLCKIIKPEKILCLGKLTFSCVYETLSGSRVSSIGGYCKDYNEFVAKHIAVPVAYGDNSSKIYALAHCGAIGTLNRNKIRNKEDRLVTDPSITDPLQRQIEDWEAVKIS